MIATKGKNLLNHFGLSCLFRIILPGHDFIVKVRIKFCPCRDNRDSIEGSPKTFGKVLAWFKVGYLPELGAEQAAGVNTNIRILLGIAYIVSFLVQFLLLLFVYNLSKKKVAEMVHTLGRENTVDNSKAIED